MMCKGWMNPLIPESTRIKIAYDEITRLRADLAKVTWQRNEAQAGLAAMTKSRDAAMRIVTAKDQQMSMLRTQQDQWSEARNTLESERAANARITADLAASQAELAHYVNRFGLWGAPLPRASLSTIHTLADQPGLDGESPA